jgi:hypothetical protein
VLALPDQPAIHFLLELDRATEPFAQLRDKAKRYARAIPHSTLARQHPVIVLAVPNHARATAANDATTGTGAPLTAVMWNKDARSSSPLAIVVSIADSLVIRAQR